MGNTIFKGIATALVTPMTEDGVNYEQFGTLIDWQIEQGIDALVIAGTTGEGSTLTDEEHKECIRFAVERANSRVPIIAGTGSNHTEYGLQLTRYACEVGADACLVVTPYYNKATQNGLVEMYRSYAEVSTAPIIVYNVPSRTGVNIEPSTYVKLADITNIRAVKEANSDISKIVDTQSLLAGRLDMYSGNDDQIAPLLAVGCKGCISVLSNVLPAETREICTRFWNGDTTGAAEMQFRVNELVRALFCEVNPIPVKAAMSAMGYCDDILRSPLTTMEAEHRSRLIAAMREFKLNV